MPVLSFSYKNLPELNRSLGGSEYQGLILTSPRAGDLVGDTLIANPDLRDVWRDRVVVCVGNRSAERIHKAGLRPVIAERSDGFGVAGVVKQEDRVHRWLFVCGNLRRDTVPGLLNEAGVAYEELEVYETHPNVDVTFNAVSQPDWVVFFSPSGVASVQPKWPSNWARVCKAAIGETTAAAMKGRGWTADAVAETPDAEALLAIITRRKNRR